MRSSIALDDGRELVIREAVPDDARDLLAYAKVVAGETEYLSFAPDEFDVALEDEREMLRRSCEAANQLFLIALIGNSIVGSLHYSAGSRPRVQHTGEFGVSVRREFWGTGIGSALIGELLDWAERSQVVTKINLRVRTDNQRAIRLYERLGFELEGTIRRDFLVGGTYHDAYWMGKLL